MVRARRAAHRRYVPRACRDRRVLLGLAAHYDELHVQPMRFLDAGEKVVVEGHHTGRIAGARFDVGFVHVWTLVDGLAIEFREYMDSGKLLPLFRSA